MLDVRDLIRIQAVVTHGGVTRAAIALGMTQPALTRSIAAAERQAGGLLFRRSRQGAEPTALCRLVLADAPEIVDRMQALNDRLGQWRGGSGEEVGVAAGPFPMPLCLAAAAALRQSRPRLRLRLETLAWPAALAQLRNGLCDLAVVTAGASFGQGVFAVEPLPPQRLAFVVAAGHPLRARARLTVPQLLRWPLVTTAHLAPRLQQALAEARAADAAPRPDRPCPAVMVESTEAWLAMVQDGAHVALITPSAAAAALARREVALLPLEAPWLVSEPAIVRLAARSLTAPANAFAEALRGASAVALAQDAALWAARMES
jgi:DNA-binding transcriptional LysR family regulator